MERECRTCKEVKPLEEFNKGNAKYGRKSECKICQGSRQKAYKERPEVKVRDREWQRKKYNQTPREERVDSYLHRKEYNKKWCKDNAEKLKKTKRAYYDKHRTGFIQRTKEWRNANPEKVRINGVVGAQRRRKTLRDHPPLQVSSVVALQEFNMVRFNSSSVFSCEYCSTIIEGSYHIEHLTPIARGGDSSIGNLAISCPSCNHEKFTKTLKEYRPDLVDYFQNRKL